MMHRRSLHCLAICLSLCAVIALCTGCPPREETAKVTVVFTADQSPLKSALVKALIPTKADVPIEDIASLKVTVSEITLVPAGDDDEEEDGEDDGEDDKANSHIVVFDGEMEVDLVDLMGVSEVLSSAEIPAGTYNQIRLSIADPELILVSDPETVITDVHLTANQRVFITGKFDVPEGNVLLVLDFGGLKLVEQGNGGYNLTPQLQADLEISSADAQATGEILEIYPDDGVLVLGLADGEVEVVYTGAAVWLPGDPDPVAGTTADLAVGQTVQVAGTLYVDGSIAADTITVQAEPTPAPTP